MLAALVSPVECQFGINIYPSPSKIVADGYPVFIISIFYEARRVPVHQIVLSLHMRLQSLLKR